MNGEEAKSVHSIAKAVEAILPALGDTPRDGTKDTPTRVAKMLLEMTEGLRTEPPRMTDFERGDNDQMVVTSGIDYWSLCEHHMVPFYGKVHVGYLPDERIVGLSKFGRLVDWVAHRPQTQEYMTAHIAKHLMEVLKPKGVIVLVEGTHLCMAMRGVKKANHVTVTTAIRGDIDKNEFYEMLRRT